MLINAIWMQFTDKLVVWDHVKCLGKVCIDNINLPTFFQIFNPSIKHMQKLKNFW